MKTRAANPTYNALLALFTGIFLSGCASPSGTGASHGTAESQSGTNRTVMPVLIVPPAENNSPGSNQAPVPENVPPEQIIRDPYTGFPSTIL
jgi:hypothetical protein